MEVAPELVAMFGGTESVRERRHRRSLRWFCILAGFLAAGLIMIGTVTGSTLEVLVGLGLLASTFERLTAPVRAVQEPQLPASWFDVETQHPSRPR